ncbi:MAG: DNA methyltransferase [Sphingomonas sp.]
MNSLLDAESNSRTHTKRQLKKLARLIKDLGFRVPILIDKHGRIIAGHARVAAARLLGLTEVPAVVVDDLSPEQIQLLAIAENRLSELGGWDDEVLAAQFQGIESLNLGCDLTLSGFDTAKIDILFSLHADEAAAEPMVPARMSSRDRPSVSRRGDLWRIGRHRLACNDARDTRAYEQVLDGERAQMGFADAPYNLKINGLVSGNGSISHPEFEMASGEMGPPQFTAFLREINELLACHSIDGAILFICMDHRHMRELHEAAEGIFEYKNTCVWVKRQGGMGSLYRSQHEFVGVFKSGTAPHINNIELGRHGRNRTNVWRYAGANSFGKGRDAALEGHPTTKPVAMVADAILDCSNRGGLILDPFVGSGTTLLAAEQTGRRGAGIELDPYYVDLAAERLGLLAKAPIIHTETGLSFDEMRVVRAREVQERGQ